METRKHLTVLDLDNTLIYGTSGQASAVKVLFRYSKTLVIYERPYAREFVGKCREAGDVIVCTTAVRDYAEKICEQLDIRPLEILAREDCPVENWYYCKSVPDYYFNKYGEITIYDDHPEMWDQKSHDRCRVVGVPEFTGDPGDEGLKDLFVSIVNQ